MRLRQRTSSLAVIIAVSLIAPTALLASQTPAHHPLSQQPFTRREKVICGPNAVYALLSACKIEVRERLIDELLLAHPAGMSLLDVRDALCAHGMRAEIRHCMASELSTATTPYIAYLKFEFSGGHYLVVLSQKDSAAHVLDPTTGTTFTTPLEKLLRASDGYVILPDARSSLVPMLVPGLSGAMTILALFSCCRSRTTKKLFLLALLLAPAATVQAATDTPRPAVLRPAADSPVYWRTGRNSGTNCLWLLLHCAGRRVDYSDLLGQTASERISLDSVANISSGFGLKLVPVHLTFSELQNSSSPLILFMEPEGIGSGTFVLPVEITPDKVSYIEGGAVRWVQQNRSDFRRSWSGYALIPAPAESRTAAALRPVPLLALLTAMWFTIRWLSPPKQISLSILLLVLCTQMPGRSAEVVEPALPNEIRDALRRQASQVEPITITWVHERARTADAMPLMQISRNSSRAVEHDEHRLTVQQEMLYSRIDRDDAGANVLEHSFNGTTYFIGRPPLSSSSHQPSLTKIDVRWLATRDAAAPWFSDVYFDLAGFSIPSTAAELRGHVTVQSRILKLLADGARLISCGDVTRDGLRRARVEIEMSDPDAVPRAGANPSEAQRTWRAAGLSQEQIGQYLAAVERRAAPPANKRLIFFLDRGRDCAVTQYEERKANGSLLVTVQNEGLRQVAERALWLPEYCQIAHYAGEGTLFGEPVTLSTIRVKSIDPGPQPATIFALSYSSPGTKVHEQSADGRRESYEIPATPGDLAQVIAQARNAGFLRGPGGVSRYWWFFAVIGAVLTIAAGIWTVRNQRAWRKAAGDS